MGGANTLNNDSSVVQDLEDGDVVYDTLTVRSLDGTAAQRIVVTVHGADNHDAMIGGHSAGTVEEDGTLTASGLLTIQDEDGGQAAFQTPESLAGTYGTFTFNAATGAWGYTLNNAASNVQALKGGAVVYDTLTVTSLDGTATQDITVTIIGLNDGATITGQSTGTVAEDGTLIASGTLTVQDVDAGDTLTDTLTVTSSDGSASQTIAVTINGKDEPAPHAFITGASDPWAPSASASYSNAMNTAFGEGAWDKFNDVRASARAPFSFQWRALCHAPWIGSRNYGASRFGLRSGMATTGGTISRSGSPGYRPIDRTA